MNKKLQFLTLFLLMVLGGANVAWAQSTYSWNADNWTDYNGNGTVTNNDGVLTCTFGQYCGSLYSTTPFKLPKRQTFIVIKGTNLVAAGGDPNVCNLNGDLGEGKLGYFTGNATNTLLYKDITDLLPSETDFFGNVTINSIALYLKKVDGEEATVTSIDFVAADLIDAMTITSNGNVSSISSLADDGEFKKTLTFTLNVDKNDIGLEITGTQKLNNSDMFLVIESNNSSLNTSSRIKLRSMTANGNKYENNNGGCYVAGREVSAGHYLYVHSFYKGSDTSANLLAQWEENTTMDITQATLYINSKGLQDTEIKIYRLGFYNLSEIMQMYSLAGEKWWFTMSNEGKLDVEIHNSATANQIRVNGNYGTENTNTTAYAAQLVRCLGALPSNFTTISLNGKLSFKTDVTPSAVDIFKDLPSTITTINLDEKEIINLPTLNPYAYLTGTKYYAFKEGSVTVPTPMGSSGNWTSLTRTFKAGYNTLCVPFNKFQVEKLSTGLTVYALSSYNSGTGVVEFAKVTANVSTNTKNIPYIVHAEEAGTYVLLGRDPETSDPFPSYYKVQQGDLRFVGSYVNEVPSGDYSSTDNYGITADGTQFAKMGPETKTGLYRAFIALPSAASVKPLVLSFAEDLATGIGLTPDVSCLKEDGDAHIYNLAGQRMSRLQNGINIVNGKKVFIK